MTKEQDSKKDLAFTLFMSGLEITEIADKVGVSRQTISKWATTGNWKERRAARSVTRTELVNKTLLAINKLLDDVNKSNDADTIVGLADRLSKFASVIEKLDKKASIVDTVEVFIAFSKWLEFRATSDPLITKEFLQTLTRLQDAYIQELANKR